MRLRDVTQGLDVSLSWFLLVGRHGAWAACRIDGRCWRHDDGHLLRRRNDEGIPEPVLPQVDDEMPRLELVASPSVLETTDGNVTDVRLTVRNNGDGRAFWVNVQRVETEPDCLLFHAPPTRVVLPPGDDAELSGWVSCPAPWEAPKAQQATLELEITTARGESLPLDPIPVRSKTPSLQWAGATWTKDADASSLVITVRNTGEQELSASTVDAQIAGFRHGFQTITQPSIGAGETATFAFALPGGFEPDGDTRVTLDVHKVDHPVHHWTFRDQPIDHVCNPFGVGGLTIDRIRS